MFYKLKLYYSSKEMLLRLKRTQVIIIEVFLLIFLIVSILIIINWIIDRVNNKKLKPSGQLISIDDENIHVIVKGKVEADSTIIYMAGGGIYSPLYDSKKICDRLAEKYRVVVLEKKGYGYSDFAKGSRKISILLEDSRRALKELRIEPPYILMPHSMAALEAIYWAQVYSSEIKAIVGLDPAVPDSYERIPLRLSCLKLKISKMILQTGIGKLCRLYSYIVSRKLQNLQLEETEDKQNKQLFYRNYGNNTVIKEVLSVSENILQIKTNPVPVDTPMYFFVSNGKGTGMDTKIWRNYLIDYVMDIKNGSYELLDSNHFLYNFEDKIIAEKTIEFIEKLDRSVRN